MSDLELERDAQNLERVAQTESAQQEVVQNKHEQPNDGVKDYIARLNEQDRKRRFRIEQREEELVKRIEELKTLEAERAKSFEAVTKLADKLDARAIAQQLKREAEAQGLVDMDLLAFVDKGIVKVTEDGDVHGAKEAILALKEKKPFAFKKPINMIQPPDLNMPPELAELLQSDNSDREFKIMTQAEFDASIGKHGF